MLERYARDEPEKGCVCHSKEFEFNPKEEEDDQVCVV